MKHRYLITAFVMVMFLSIFSINVVSAEDTVIIPFNQEFDLKRSCFNNGSFCSNIAVCNITIINPDDTVLANNTVMTNQVSYHNYTITQTDNDQLGDHPVSMVCCDPANNLGCAADTFRVKVTGDGFSFDVFPTQLSILIVALLLIVVGSFSEKLTLLKTTGSIMTMVIGAITLYPGYSNLNYSTLPGQAIGVASIGIGFFFLIQDSFSFDKQVDHYDQDDDGRFHD